MQRTGGTNGVRSNRSQRQQSQLLTPRCDELVQLGHDPSRGYSGIPGFKPDNPQVLRYGAYIYNDVSAGYEIKAINTRIDVGVNNLTDKQPPMLYENNGGAGNGNTATNYFDPIGRFYWARLTYRF